MSMFRRMLIGSKNYNSITTYKTKFTLKYEYGNPNQYYNINISGIDTYGIGFDCKMSNSTLQSYYLDSDVIITTTLTKKDTGEIVSSKDSALKKGAYASGEYLIWTEEELLGDGLYEVEIIAVFSGPPIIRGSLNGETLPIIFYLEDYEYNPSPDGGNKGANYNYILCLYSIEEADPADKFNFSMTFIA